MIKEHIEKLPGGKEFIKTQIFLGIIIGATSMFMLSALIGLTVYGEAGAMLMLTRDSAIMILLVVSGFLWIILSVVLIIAYFYRMNRADNIYMTNSR